MGEAFGGSAQAGPRNYLFLQGPISPFFAELGASLEKAGHRVLRINVNLGDVFFWRAFSSGKGTVRSFHGRVVAWPAWVRSLMHREAITDLILLGEQRYYQKHAIEAAHDLGINVTVTDFGYIRPDWIVMEPDGMNGGTRMPLTPDAIRALARQAPEPDMSVRFPDDFGLQARWDVLYHLLTLVGRPFFPFWQTYHIHHPLLNYLGTGWRLLRKSVRSRHADAEIARLHADKARYWVLPMQMEVDFSIRAYSPFPDMLTPLRDVVASFAATAGADDVLVVKLHPLDPGIRNWRRLVDEIAREHGAAGRVLFIDGGSLEALLERARGVVTINSTVGIWAIRAGVPVKILGNAVYDVEGLVHGGSLESFWCDPTVPDTDLAADFIRAIAAQLHIRGVYYHPVGRAHAVAAAVRRLLPEVRAALEARVREATGPAGRATRPGARAAIWRCAGWAQGGRGRSHRGGWRPMGDGWSGLDHKRRSCPALRAPFLCQGRLIHGIRSARLARQDHDRCRLT